MLPCNGLLYLPPDQCACDNLGKLVGFYAVAGKPAVQPTYRDLADPDRLKKGPAYGSVGTSESKPPSADDWPNHRHDNERSGRASTRLNPKLGQQWSTELGGELSTLVSANGRRYVAQKDTHAVICLDAKTGKELWRFTAGGNVDSPPTIARGMAVFGSSDGCVYALSASDGALVWKFQAALGDRRLIARDQIESVWPLHGSTMVENGAVYVAAGRNAYYDQGISLYKLDVATGRPLVAKRYYGRDPEDGRRIDLFALPTMDEQKRPRMSGLKADVFSSGTSSLFLGGVAVTRDLKLIGDGEPHLMSHMQLLDDESFERSCWIYGTFLDTGKLRFPIGPGGEIGGVIMAFDDHSVYGVNDPSSMIGKGVYSAVKVIERVNIELSSRALKGKAIKKNEKWRNEDVPVNGRSIVVNEELLIVAGPERFDEVAVEKRLNRIPTSELKLDPILADALDTARGKKGSLVWVMDKADGEKRHSVKLDSAPVFDGMIAANGCLYLATLDGRVVCLGADR